MFDMAAFLALAGRHPKVYTPRKSCRPAFYRRFYRFDEQNVEWLADHFLEDSGETRGGALTVKTQMETFLRYISDPGFQLGVAEDVGISQPTVSRTFHAVLDKIVENAGLWIHFPSTVQEMQLAMDNWQTTYGMPCAIGAVDCTHIRVLKPQGRHAHGDEYVTSITKDFHIPRAAMIAIIPKPTSLTPQIPHGKSDFTLLCSMSN